jgi:hypothetical protein
MTVFVDDMNAAYGRMVMCHMIARTEDELHEMARKIGVQRKWYQGDHYDICLAKKRIAVAAGAKEVTQRELAQIRRFYKGGGHTEERACTKSRYGAHCEHWWDGEECCSCGSPAAPRVILKMIEDGEL